MRSHLNKNLTTAVALTLVLQMTLITVTPAFSYDGRWVKAGDSSIGKPTAFCFTRCNICKIFGQWFGLSKIPGLSGVALSASSLRFDLKQNLSTWPVLSNRLTRSPPAPFAR